VSIQRNRFSLTLTIAIVTFLPLSSVAFPLGSGTFGSSIFGDSDGDLVLDTLDAFPNDASETKDTDSDGVGDNADAFPSDASKTVDTESGGTIDNNAVLNDPASFGLITIEEKDSVVASAIESQVSACLEAPASCGIDLSIDVDGDGSVDPLTDGLLIIRYLLGFSGNSLIDGAVGTDATRKTSEEIEDYIKARLPNN
jgi:hypothetical protein